jgi:hypothetical protein
MMYNAQDDVHNPSRDSFRNLCEADSQDGFDAYAYQCSQWLVPPMV